MEMNQEKTDERYDHLDILKLLCAFFVVCIHCGCYKSKFWFWFEPLTRTAVPIYFLISGYFFIKVCESGARKQIFKIIKATILWSVIYGIAEFGLKIRPISMDGWIEYTKENLFPEFVKFLFANKPMFNLGGFMWYMFAFLYVYIIFLLAYRKQKLNLLVKISFLLLFLQYIIGLYSFVFGIETSIIRTRNFLLTGIPFFGLGIWLQKNWESCYIKYKSYIINILKVLFIFFFLFSILEKYLLVVIIGVDINSDIYLSTLFLSVTFFCYALASEKNHSGKPWITSFAQIGKKYSSNIYFVHSIIVFIIDNLTYKIRLNTNHFLYWGFPFIIYFISLLCLIGYNEFKLIVQKKYRI